MKVTVAAISLLLAVDVNASTHFHPRRETQREMQTEIIGDDLLCSEDEDGALPQSLDFSTGFCTSLPDFHLNGNFFPNYPTYLDSGDCALRLTSEQDYGAIASAYLGLSLHERSSSFSTHIKYRIYGNTAPSADGMAFIIQQDPRGFDALGAGGGGYFGVYSIEENDADTVKPALVVEMDSHYNGNLPDLHDSCNDAIHVMLIHHDGTALEVAETCRAVRTDDGTGGLWVDFDGSTGLLSVFHSASNGDSKPEYPIIIAEVDLSLFDPSQPLYYGFTAATGGLTDNHDVLGFTFTQS